MKGNQFFANVFRSLMLLTLSMALMAPVPLYAAKTFAVSSDVAGNPAVDFYSKDFQAEFNTDWMQKADLHWKARQGASWTDYIGKLTEADIPAALPEIPEADEAGSPVCEAEGNGQCFYISAEDGDDSNPGTYAKPWKTYLNIVYYLYERLPENHVLSKNGGLQPGDVVYFMSGDYSDTYVSEVENGTEMRHGFYLYNIHGSETAPIVFAAYPGENPVFSAVLSAKPMPAVELSLCSNVIIDGFEIREASGDGLLLADSRDTEVRNCHIYNTGGMRNTDHSGILLSGSENAYIHHNLIHDNYGRTGEENGGISSNIRISQGNGKGGNILIRRNMIFYSETDEGDNPDGGFGILFSRSADKMSDPDAVFEADHNILYNCGSASLASATFNSRIHHNLILDSAPILFSSIDGLVWQDGNIIENNTIVNGQALIYNPVAKYGPPGSMIFRKNITIDREAEYGGSQGIIRICTDCEDSLYDRVMSGDRLDFTANVYCNAVQDLNLAEAWLLFNNNSAPAGIKGDVYNFPAWQDLGFDTDSEIYYGYTTPETALYPFDGNAEDQSGEGNHAVVKGAELTWNRSGIADMAYDFNGTDSYIATPLDINPSKMPLLTMSAWVWPRQTGGDANAGRRQVFSHDDGGFDRSLLMEYSKWHVFTGGSNWDTQASVDIQTWQHVAVVFTGNNVYFYKNGQKYTYGSAPGNASSLARFIIGNNPLEAWDEFFDGVIDDVRVFNRALSDEEIQELLEVPTDPQIILNEDFSMNVCVGYLDKSYSFTFDLFPQANDIYWKMDTDSFAETENSGNCIDVAENLDMDMPVSFDGKQYRFMLHFDTPPEAPEGLYWKMDMSTFREVRDCIAINEDLSMKVLVEEDGNRYAFSLLPYADANDPTGFYWKMAEGSYKTVNHVTENYISLPENKDLDICVRYQDMQLGVMLHFIPSLSGNLIWKLDPESLREM